MARGSIRSRSQGSWELRWDGPRGEDGKRNTQRRTFRGTKKGAETELNRVMADLSKSEAERASEMPLAVCCELFLKERTGTDLRPNTIAMYMRIFKNYLLPECGNMLLARVDRNALQKVIQRMIDSRLAPYTINVNHGFIKGFFSWAVRAELLPVSPVKGLTLPECSRKSSAQILSAPEALEVLDLLEETPYWLPIFLGLHTGMRPGEVLGLSWDDVDLAKGHLSVTYTLLENPGVPSLGPPKTKSSERLVAISPEAIEVLREREQVKPDRFWCRIREKVGDSLEHVAVPVEFRQLCALPNGYILSHHELRHHFRKTTYAAGLRPVRLHDLRHTHASLLLLDGVPMHVVSKRLGHASIQITIDLYAHLLPSSDPAAAARFADILKMAS